MRFLEYNVFSFFTIKMLQALATPFGVLIMKNVLLLQIKCKGLVFVSQNMYNVLCSVLL